MMKEKISKQCYAKRMLSVLLAVLMAMSLLTVAIVPASAALTFDSIHLLGINGANTGISQQWGAEDANKFTYADGEWTLTLDMTDRGSWNNLCLGFVSGSLPQSGVSQYKFTSGSTMVEGTEYTVNETAYSGNSLAAGVNKTITFHVKEKSGGYVFWYTSEGGTTPTTPTTTEPSSSGGDSGNYWLTGYMDGVHKSSGSDNRKFSYDSATGTYKLSNYQFSNTGDQYFLIYDGTKYYEANTTNDTSTSAQLKDNNKTSYDDNFSKVKLTVLTDSVYDFTYNPTTKILSYSVKQPEMFYANATLFDYYYDKQVDSGTIDQGTQTGSSVTPYGYFNNKISSYFNTASSTSGNGLPATKDVYVGNTKYSSTGFTPLYFGDLYNHTPSYYHYYRLANVAANNDTNAAAMGLIDLTLDEDGNPTQNGLAVPYFNKNWFDTTKEGSKALGKYYEDLGFPLKVTTNSETGLKTYSYDSRTDGNRYYKSGEKNLQIGENVIQRTSEEPNAGPGYFPFNATNPSDQKYLNYGNGTVLEIPFFMTEDGKINDEPITFNFSGDDDVWVFIDGVLVLDLGGAHARTTGNINFSTAVATVDKGYRSYYSNDSNSATDWNATVSTRTHSFASLIPDLYDTSKQHTLTMFHMERGMYESNMYLSFTLPQFNTFEVINDIDTSKVNPALLADTYVTADDDAFAYDFQSDSANTGIADSNAMYPNDDRFARDLADDNNILSSTSPLKTGITASKETLLEKASSATQAAYRFTGSPLGFANVTNSSYVWGDKYLKNTAGSTQGVGLLSGTVTGGKDQLYLLFGQNARFYNQFIVGSNMILEQKDALNKVTRSTTESADFEAPSNRSAAYYYNTSWQLLESKMVLGKSTSENTTIVDDTNVTVENGNTGQFKFARYTDLATLDTSGRANVIAQFVNEVKTQDITITKTLADGASNNGSTFSFVIEFDSIFGGTSSGYKEYATMEYTKDGSTYHGSEIELAVGQSATIKGIPVGTKYRITEQEVTGYNPGKITVANAATGTATDTATVDLKNGIVTGTITNSTTSIDVGYENTNLSFEVIYYYHPRKVVTGKPTEMDNDTYIAVKRTIPRLDKETIIAYAPVLSNILDAYSLTEADIDITKTPAEAVFTNAPKEYTVNYSVKGTAAQESGVHNTLADSNTVKADEDGFMYWASEQIIDPVTKATQWEPLSTQYRYGYRIIQDLNIRAVYEGDLNPSTGEEFPTLIPADSDQEPGEGEYKFGVNTSDVIYDAYNSGEDAVGVPINQNRIKANVPINPVGSPDTDKEITKIGFVRVSRAGEYATAVSQDTLLDFIEGGSANAAKLEGNARAVEKFEYTVDYWMEADEEYETSSKGVTITNKNRANFVLDFADIETNEQKYYSIYTFMLKDGQYYVSPSPAFVNLLEAPRQSDPLEPVPVTKYTVSVSSADTTLGTASASKSLAAEGDTVRFIATPKLPYQDGNENDIYPEFDKWVINGVEYSTATVDYTMGAGAVTAVAHFKTSSEPIYAATITQATNGSAKITKVNGATVADATQASLKENDTFTVTAAPSSGYQLVGWKVNGTADTNTTLVRTFTMGTEAMSIEPIFTEIPTDITVSVVASPTAGGTVSISDGGSQSGSSVTVQPGTTVALTASASSGYEFKGWKAGSETTYASTSTSYNPAPTSTITYTAVFEEVTTVTITAASGGNGTATVNNQSSVTVASGTTVTLKAVPATNYKFKQWNDGNTSAERTVSATSSKTYTATFEVETKTILFTDEYNWIDKAAKKLYAYAYTGSGTVVTKDYPGTEMTYVSTVYGKKQYSITIPVTAKTIIFNNGESGSDWKKTANITIDYSKTGYYPTSDSWETGCSSW